MHFRYPPDKRCNYSKIGVSSPFMSPWDLLLNDHGSKTESSFHVVRSRTGLQRAKKLLNNDRLDEGGDGESGLLPVTLRLCGKGTLKPGALVCNPSQEDISAFKQKGGKSFACEEPLHEDANELERKTHRAEHRKKMASLRNRWKQKKDQLTQIRAQAKLK